MFHVMIWQSSVWVKKTPFIELYLALLCYWILTSHVPYKWKFSLFRVSSFTLSIFIYIIISTSMTVCPSIWCPSDVRHKKFDLINEVGARSYKYTGRSNAAWVRVKKWFACCGRVWKIPPPSGMTFPGHRTLWFLSFRWPKGTIRRKQFPMVVGDLKIGIVWMAKMIVCSTWNWHFL